jgi:hypothetical protein
MKQIINNIFVGLGVIFLVLIIAGLWFFISDPYNLKPMIFGTPYVPSNSSNPPIKKDNTNSETATTSSESATASVGFQLSDAQKQALVSFGIDPSTVPSSIDAKQEACFVSVLGQARVSEIKDGAVPSGVEFFKAKSCI